MSKTYGYLFAMENICHLVLFEEKQFRGKEVIEQIGLASKHLHKRGAIANFCINTTIGKLLLKIGTMLGKAMLFQVIYLVCVRIFASF